MELLGAAYRGLLARRALSRFFLVCCLLRTADAPNFQVILKLKRLSEIASLVLLSGMALAYTPEAEAPPRLSQLTGVDLNPGSAPLNLIRLAKFEQKLGIQGQTEQEPRVSCMSGHRAHIRYSLDSK